MKWNERKFEPEKLDNPTELDGKLSAFFKVDWNVDEFWECFLHPVEPVAYVLFLSKILLRRRHQLTQDATTLP